MSRFYIIALATTLVACMGITARSQTNQAGGAAAGPAAQAGAQAPGAAANAAGQTRGGLGTTPPVVSEANPVGGQNPALGVNAAGQGRGGFGDLTGFTGFDGVARQPFFADPAVQQELGLSQQDMALLNQAYAENWNRYNQGVLGIGNNLPAQQRLMELQRLQAQFNEGFGQTVNSSLTNPQLLQRFNQLNYQFQNFDAFNDPVVRNQLNLTPQQQRQIRRLGSEWRDQLRRLRRAGNDVDPQLADQQFNQLQQQFQGALNQVLTPQQQQSWTGLTGNRFSFPRTSYVPPENAEWRDELRQRDIIPHEGTNDGTVQDPRMRRNVTPHASGTARQNLNQGVRRNVTPHARGTTGTQPRNQGIRRNVAPQDEGTAGAAQQNGGVRRNVTPHGGTQSAQSQDGATTR